MKNQILKIKNRFQKGHTPWNKDTHIQTNTGRTHFKKGDMPWSYGKKGYELVKVDKKQLYQLYVNEKLSTKEVAQAMKIPKATINKRLTFYGWKRTPQQAMLKNNPAKQPEAREKIRASKLGDKNPAWKDGISPIKKRIRRSIKYREWRETIFKQDNYICQMCGENGNLNANHIKKFSDYPELRFELNNGITLCKNCHLHTVNQHEEEWESYFNFNLATRGFIQDEFIPRRLE